MAKDKDKHFIIVSYVLLIVVIVVASLIWQAQQVEQKMRDTKQPVQEPQVKQKRQEQPTISKKLIPANPADYGMIVTHEFDKPTTQDGWNEFIKESLTTLKDKTSPEIIHQIKNKINKEITKKPRRIKKKIAWIDAAITKCKEILKTEPANEQIKQKLERLMILKALGEELGEFAL